MIIANTRQTDHEFVIIDTAFRLLVLVASGVSVVDGDFSCTPTGPTGGPVGLVSLSVIELVNRGV